MVNLPTVTINGDQSAGIDDVTIYRSDRNRFVLAEIDSSGSFSPISPLLLENKNGLTRMAFVLPRSAQRVAAYTKAGIVISSI